MKIDELTQEIENDSIIDPIQLDKESLRIPYLQAKYFKIFMEEFKILKGMEQEFARVKKDRSLYYLGKADDEDYRKEPKDHKVLKQDLDLYLNADENVSRLEGKRVLQKAKVEMVESFLKSLNNRGFQIKNAIEWKKFQAGA